MKIDRHHNAPAPLYYLSTIWLTLMKFALNLRDWQARAPGLSTLAQWLDWAQYLRDVDPLAPQQKLTALPMMTARRLSSGSRLAVECGLTMLKQHSIDAVVYTSRHGELERNYRILEALATEQSVSPTDFALSVHNASVGNLTIVAGQPIVSSSLSAGKDTFQQGLLEVISLLAAGHRQVLMVDFDGTIPDFYRSSLPAQAPAWAYAVAMVFEQGESLTCSTRQGGSLNEDPLAQSLQFLRNYLRDEPAFDIEGDITQWHWSRQ